MLRDMKLVLSAAATLGVLIGASAAQAQSAKPGATSAQPQETARSGSAQAKADDFEENRRMHMQKSKENNEKKGAE